MPDARPDATGSISSDRPISAPAQDRLGFSKIAEHLAQAFLRNDLSEGFVVGVEGSWGSGKSSLVGMALTHLRNHDRKPIVVEFQPWLVGNRNDLLTELFAVLSAELAKRGGSAGISFKKNAARFANAAMGLGTALDFAGKVGFAGANLAAEGIKAAGRGLGEFARTSLFDLKQSLSKDLANLNTPVIIFIDDLDRLDPTEAVEVLRLVRAVADFPNVGYILAYDAEVLAQNIQRALGVSDGRAYIEKIVQASFRVPMPMEYDLRNWFKDEASKLLPTDTLSLDARQRYEVAFQNWTPFFLRTPRDVIRALNALRLYAVPVADRTDPADMVFLHLVRLKNPALHRWIEGYLHDLAILDGLGALDEDSVQRARSSLLEALKGDTHLQQEVVSHLHELLPGGPPGLADPHGENFPSDNQETGQFIPGREDMNRDRRLGSPHNYRFYFAFSEPEGILSDAALTALFQKVHDEPKAGASQLQALLSQARPQGKSMGRVLLDRLSQVEELPAEAILPFLLELSKLIDDFEEASPSDLWGYRDSPFGILRFVPAPSREDALATFFLTSQSLDWLAAIVGSTETEHRDQGIQSVPVSKRFLSNGELEAIRSAFATRLRQSAPAAIRNTACLGLVLCTWARVDCEEAKAWVGEQTQDDADFVGLLSGMKVRVGSMFGGVDKIDPADLDSLFSSSQYVVDRLTAISDQAFELKPEADSLLAAISAGSRS